MGVESSHIFLDNISKEFRICSKNFNVFFSITVFYGFMVELSLYMCWHINLFHLKMQCSSHSQLFRSVSKYLPSVCVSVHTGLGGFHLCKSWVEVTSFTLFQKVRSKFSKTPRTLRHLYQDGVC